MKTVMTLFLGSAAAVVFTAAGNAAEVPAQAKPMEYVKACPQSDGGLWYVPGAASCFTVGRAASFYDLISLNQQAGTNLGATGQQVFGSTWQFGSGFSASLSAEGGGAAAAGNAGNNWHAGGKVTVDFDSGLMGLGALTVDSGGYVMPDVVANVRVDQAWGSAMLKAALHQNRGGNYTSFPTGPGVGCIGGTANTTQCGHSDDKLGWAIGAGLALNIPGLPGDFDLARDQLCTRRHRLHLARKPVMADVGRRPQPRFRLGERQRIPQRHRSRADAILGPRCGGEHRWNPQWRTAVYGGFERIDYSARAEDMICGRGGFAGSPSALAGLAAANCSPGSQLVE